MENHSSKESVAKQSNGEIEGNAFTSSASAAEFKHEQVAEEEEKTQERESSKTAKEKRAHVIFEHVTYNLDLNPNTYWLTRIVFLRSLAFVYGFAFLIALNQNKQLIGKNGLLPADKFMQNLATTYGGFNPRSFQMAPTLLWYLDLKDLDFHLDAIAGTGLVISLCILMTGAANMLAMATLWALYHSLVNVGQRWYMFGWESQLLETGFLAIFFCPLWTWKKFPRETPPSWVVVWGYRWLLFRIMIGAGMIKVRGDRCWKDLTCMNYHYETQPVPNPASFFLHQTPESFHKFETGVNHVIELVVPWFMFLPRPFKLVCGLLQILFQAALVTSGNLSFLNWLTMLPAICYFDDRFLSCLFNKATVDKVNRLQSDAKRPEVTGVQEGRLRSVISIALGLILAYLSIPVVMNLLSPTQRMNSSFEPFRIVNTYGAFGSVTKRRMEVIIQATYNNDPNDPYAEWKEYEFKCKPGNVTRPPCTISPYHYRLDWLMWFAAFQDHNDNPWLIHLMAKLLANDEQAASLIDYNPFEGKRPPKYIRAELYRYVYTKWNSTEARAGQWWKRKRQDTYMPPISLDTVGPYLKQKGWNIPMMQVVHKPAVKAKPKKSKLS